MGYQLVIPANHPALTYINTTYGASLNTAVPYSINLGNISSENQDLQSDLTDCGVPLQGSNMTLEYDWDGVIREITIVGVFVGTALQVSQFILTMEALQNFMVNNAGCQGLNSPYTLVMTAGSFPTYPYTTWTGTTGRSLNVVVGEFQLGRTDETPAADLVNYTLTLKERALVQ